MPRPRRYKKRAPKRNDRAIRKVVNSVIARQSEKKFLDTDHGILNCHSTAGVAVTKITGQSQGDGSSARNGDQIYIKSLQLRMLTDCGTNRDTQQRYILIQWMEDDSGGAPGIGDILNNTTNADLPTSYYVLNPQKKFKVLYDKVVCFNANADNVARNINVFIPGKKLAQQKVSYDSGATTGVGMFYLFTMGTQATGACKAVQSRLRYLDN